MRSSRVCPGWSSSSLRPGPGPVGVDASQLELVAEAGLDEVSKPDIVIVPGGPFSHDELDGRCHRVAARGARDDDLDYLDLHGRASPRGRPASSTGSRPPHTGS